MEALMNPRSFPFKLTPEDRLTIRTWKWRLAAVYGAVLLILALIVTAAPRHEPDSANRGMEPGFSAVIADRRLPVH
jgi:hypothetical protein